MLVLIDYDNLPPKIATLGVVRALERVAVTILNCGNTPRLRFRLYGGWYDGAHLSRRAQKVAMEVGAFPRTLETSEEDTLKSTILTAELAYSQLAEPAKSLTYTFRERAMPNGLFCRDGSLKPCLTPQHCGLRFLPEFLARQTCPENNCQVKSNNVFGRSEQKLVDVMLASDLLFIAYQLKEPLAIVSSDHDMWPAIRQAVVAEGQILHVLRKDQPPPDYYRPDRRTNYRFTLLES